MSSDPILVHRFLFDVDTFTGLERPPVLRVNFWIAFGVITKNWFTVTAFLKPTATEV